MDEEFDWDNDYSYNPDYGIPVITDPSIVGSRDDAGNLYGGNNWMSSTGFDFGGIENTGYTELDNNVESGGFFDSLGGAFGDFFNNIGNQVVNTAGNVATNVINQAGNVASGAINQAGNNANNAIGGNNNAAANAAAQANANRNLLIGGSILLAVLIAAGAYLYANKK